MTTDDDLHGLATAVSQLRRRPVQIVVADPAPAVAAPAATITVPRQRAVAEPDGAAAASPAAISPGASKDIGPALAEARSSWLGRAALIDQAGIAATAGLFIPAFLVHGDAQTALIGAGGALLSSVSLRVMERLSRRGEA